MTAGGEAGPLRLPASSQEQEDEGLAAEMAASLAHLRRVEAQF